MTIVCKALGAAFVAVGLVDGAYSLVFVLYEGQGNPDDADAIWVVFEWFMAVAVILLALVAYAMRRALPADADLREWLTANVRFYASLALLLMFFNAWFAERWGVTVVPFEWIVVDVAFTILAVSTGLRLLREEPRTA